MSFNIRKILLIPVWCLVAVIAAAQVPAGYYDPANGLTGKALQQALHNIIDDHTSVSYTPGVWNAFQTTDKKPDGTVWDMYSDKPSGTPAYTFTFVTEQCGSTNGPEGFCYNREHSFPKSWFNDGSPMLTDLFHIYPTDYFVNNKRDNNPFGETSSATYTSSNGSKLGPCSVSGYTGTVFEPIDEYKGDFARSYFYMATRYYGEDSGWPGSDMVAGSQPKPWALAMLLTWSRNDPVSQKEIDRNNAVYDIQDNRNPFIDYPLYIEMIWGNLNATNDATEDKGTMVVYPNPATTELKVTLPETACSDIVLQIYDLNGCLVKTTITEESSPKVDLSGMSSGMYLLQATCGTKQYVSRFVIAE